MEWVAPLAQFTGSLISGYGSGVTEGKKLKESRRQFDISSGLEARGVAVEESLARQKIEEEQRRQRFLSNLRKYAGGLTKRAVMAMKGGGIPAPRQAPTGPPKMPAIPQQTATQGVLNGL